ncbi:MAG: extracellular solute-binding protein [Roseburia sp.]|nr:extracellular solute-binding protein [Roseburia sp.]MCM1277670.1 extracellular solute-binding protein [Robinsoniella sp.]
MKHQKKYLTVGLSLLIMLLLLFTGCERKKDEIITMANNPQSIYQYNSLPSSFMENEMIYTAFVMEEKIFVATIQMKQEQALQKPSSYRLYSLDMDGKNLVEIPFTIEENQRLCFMDSDGMGNILLLLGERNGIQSTLYRIDKNGVKLEQYDLTDVLAAVENATGFSKVIIDEDNIYMLSPFNAFIAINKSGEILTQKEGFFSDFVMLDSGEILLSEEKEGSVIEKFDANSKKLSVYYRFPEESQSQINYFVASENYEFYYYNKKGLYAYEAEGEKNIQLIDWENSNLSSEWLSNIYEISKGEFLCVNAATTGDQKYEFIKLSAGEKTASGKINVYMAGIQIDNRIKAAVMQFNQKNEKYQIKIKDYGKYEEPLAKINAELTADEAFDLICVKNIPEHILINRGILTDLYAYLEHDNDIAPEDLVAGFLEALGQDGHLYTIAPGFGISTVVGRASQVGDEIGWTIEEFQEAIVAMGDEMNIFYAPTNEEVLKQFTIANLDSFVDWKKGECTFDNAAFTSILEFANQYQESSNINGASMPSMVQNNELLLVENTIVDFTDIMLYSRLFGANVTFVGYPTVSGTGNAFDCQGMDIGICSKSKNPEGAWEFLKYLLSEEYQKNHCYPDYFPINMKCLQYYIDVTSADKQFITEEGITVEPYFCEITYDDYEVKMGAMTDEEIKAFWRLVDSTARINTYDEELINIIMEEARTYFDGNKSVEDTVKAIEKRVNIYLSEQQ